jgi:hypothetical protein
MDDNVMHIFGFVIKPIHVSVFYNSIFLLMGAGSIYAWFKTRWQSRGNRHMHRYVHSVNEVSDVDREGYRTLKLRNLGMVEHVDTVIHGDELGERIMRALILRPVGLLESGASGPVIIGHASHAVHMSVMAAWA